MYGEAGDAEARGDRLFAEQRILTNRRPQLLGYLDRLRSVRFWHEDHKFVSAVTGYHVRTPAVLLQNLPHPMQNQISLQMPIEIINEFEPVQINQNQGEGPARARRAFPFARERFH